MYADPGVDVRPCTGTVSWVLAQTSEVSTRANGVNPQLLHGKYGSEILEINLTSTVSWINHRVEGLPFVAMESAETCDCFGWPHECQKCDYFGWPHECRKCCDMNTCSLNSGATCYSDLDSCCTNCKRGKKGDVCRPSRNKDCDPQEICAADLKCPKDVLKPDDKTTCTKDKASGTCKKGECVSTGRSESAAKDGKKSDWWKVLIVLGAVILALVIAFLVYLCMKRRNKPKSAGSTSGRSSASKTSTSQAGSTRPSKTTTPQAPASKPPSMSRTGSKTRK